MNAGCQRSTKQIDRVSTSKLQLVGLVGIEQKIGCQNGKGTSTPSSEHCSIAAVDAASLRFGDIFTGIRKQNGIAVDTMTGTPANVNSRTSLDKIVPLP
jgi:hypothetical protein